MSSIRRRLFVLLASACLLASPGTMARVAEAHTCNNQCGRGGRVCGGMASSVYKGCRFECLANFAGDPAGRKACVATCRSTLVADRADCALDFDACQGICATAADPRCADDVCSYSYGDCREAVRQATRACVVAAGTNGLAIQACVEPGNLMTNTGRVALQDCIDNAATGLVTCIAGC